MPNGFFDAFGFSENPFASTNADKEPKLSSYFVPPPYFASVRGDPANPKSHVILAPRGAGKTAQKVMIEEFAERETDHPILCVTYDNFRTFNKAKLSSISVDWHLTQIIQRMLAAISALITEGHGKNLSDSDKRVLSYSFSKFLGDLSAADAVKAFNSVRSRAERFSEFLSRNGENIAAVLSAIAAKWDFGKVEIDKLNSEMKEENLPYIFERLVGVIKSFGFSSVYILIDRVDEVADLGGDASSACEFISPLINNIHIMEIDGVAFKMFLWDKTEDYMTASGFRRDRIPVNRLDWTTAELQEMLSKRLEAFSSGTISNLNQLIDPGLGLDVHKLICLLSIGSPRDVIRLAQKIVDEHTRIIDDGSAIAIRSIESGIKKFSRERCLELYGTKIDELTKIGMVSFTIGDLANDIFRISHQAARNKIQNYLLSGAVFKSGEIENPGNRPLHQYSIADPRLVFLVLSSYDLNDALSAVFFMCKRCDELLVREGPEVSCHKCAFEFTVSDEDTLLFSCSTGSLTD